MATLANSSRRAGTDAPAASDRMVEDRDLLRAAAELMRELGTPDPRIYWTDFLGSAALGYAGMAGAVWLSGAWAWVAAFVAVLALYRAGSFIHELTHAKRSQLPGFHTAWNLIVGVPLLVPSFLYEGVHALHHQKIKYGTVEDPEYLPLALMKPWTVPLFVVAAAFAPIALLFRFGVLTPLGLVFPKLRALTVARYSALSINPSFRRRAAEGEIARVWRWTELAASGWAILLIALVVTGAMPLATFGTLLGIVSATLVLNQIRTLVAHLWENDGGEMSVTAQYLDSVNVPPPALLAPLWAPVGLRYHATHHLVPSMPYHALGETHRRLAARFGGDAAYARANYAGLPGLVWRLQASSWRRGSRGLPTPRS